MFEEAYTQSALTKNEPRDGQTSHRRGSARQGEALRRVPGQGRHSRTEAFGDPGTVVHEAMHLFSSPYLRVVGYNATEGTTEYFTKLLCTEVGIKRGVHYADRLAPVEKLIALLGGMKSRPRRTSRTSSRSLEAAVDAKDRRATFDQWVTAMRAGKYAEADALLQ